MLISFVAWMLNKWAMMIRMCPLYRCQSPLQLNQIKRALALLLAPPYRSFPRPCPPPGTRCSCSMTWCCTETRRSWQNPHPQWWWSYTTAMRWWVSHGSADWASPETQFSATFFSLTRLGWCLDTVLTWEKHWFYRTREISDDHLFY